MRRPVFEVGYDASQGINNLFQMVGWKPKSVFGRRVFQPAVAMKSNNDAAGSHCFKRKLVRKICDLHYLLSREEKGRVDVAGYYRDIAQMENAFEEALRYFARTNN